VSATDAFEISETMIVVAVRLDDDNVELAIAERRDLASSFVITELLDDVNSAANETDPWLSPDRSVLYFTSARSGTQRIYRATRR